MRAMLLVLILAGCAKSAESKAPDPREAYVRHIGAPYPSPDIYAVTDTVTGVVCYTTQDMRGGISCLQPRAVPVESPR